MATLRERLDADLKDAMRAKAELKLMTIRAIKSAVKYKEVEAENRVLEDSEILAVIASEVKKRRDAAAEYKAASRPELAEKEEQEIALLQVYLPAQLSAEALTAEIAKAIAEAGATGPKDMGAVMKIVTPRLKGQTEGQLISSEVKLQLSKLG